MANVYAHEEPVKRELGLSNKQKVIVTVDKLRELIPGICKVCREAITVTENISGAVLSIKWNCCNGHSDSWSSYDVLTVKKNQIVCMAAILLSGNNFTKFDLLAKFLSLETISESVFYKSQKLHCCPAIQNMWANVKTEVHSYLLSSGVTVAGDGWNSSPGHTARYCVYTLMEEMTKMVVDIEVIDKRKTEGKSAAMEKKSHVEAFAKIERGLDHKSCCDRCLYIYQISSERDERYMYFFLFYNCNLALPYY